MQFSDVCHRTFYSSASRGVKMRTCALLILLVHAGCQYAFFAHSRRLRAFHSFRIWVVGGGGGVV